MKRLEQGRKSSSKKAILSFRDRQIQETGNLKYEIRNLKACCITACLLFSAVANLVASDVWDGSKVIPVHKLDLMDEDGIKILPDEKTPKAFSASTTCGACHDYKKISGGWHFSSEGDLNGQVSEPWILLDEKTGTQIPFSLRSSSGLWGLEQLGISDWDFIKYFGRHMPGGGPGEGQESLYEKGARWNVSGKLEVNCMACHNGSKCQDMTEWVKQVARENYRWAATAASGIGDVSGVASRLSDSWVPADGFNPDDMYYNVPPSVQYHKSDFDSKDRALLDIGKPKDERCLQCHSVAKVGVDKKEVTCDIHSASGMNCVSCHRNEMDHNIDRGVDGMYSCEGCHNEGTYGAPQPEHKGLPPVHLEKLACTTCHSGAVLNEQGELALVRTSRANRLGIHGRAQWFTEAPRIQEPVFALRGDGKIAPSRIVWPSFWGRKEGDKIVPLKAEDVMTEASDLVDPSASVSEILSTLADSSISGGKAVFVAGDKLYERNYDGGLDLLDYNGPAPVTGRQFGYLLSNNVESIVFEYDASEPNAFYGLHESEQNRLQVLLDSLRSVAPAGSEPVWKLDGILHRLIDVDYELVPASEVQALLKSAEDAKNKVEALAAELGVSAEVDGTRQKFYRKSDKAELTASKTKTPELYDLKMLMRDQAAAESKVNELEVFADKAYRNTFDKGIAKRLLVEPSDIGPAKGSAWGWLKDGVFTPFVSDAVVAMIENTVCGDEIVFTEDQVAMVLSRLGADHVYVCKGKVFSLDAKGELTAAEHVAAEPVLWPIAHDVRPAAQALGSGKCADCHSATSDFFFASVLPQGALVTDKVVASKMYEFMELSGGFHRIFGLTFIVRPLFKLFLLGMAGIAGLVLLLYVLLGLNRITDIIKIPILESWAMRIGCISAIVLTLTGFCASVCLGRAMDDYYLLSHIMFGALYALCLAVLAVIRARFCKLIDDAGDKYSLTQKVCFWILVFCGVVLIMTVLASMVPVVSSSSQHYLILAHRYAAVLSLIVAGVYAFKRKV